MGFQSPVRALPPAALEPFLIIVCQSSPGPEALCKGKMSSIQTPHVQVRSAVSRSIEWVAMSSKQKSDDPVGCCAAFFCTLRWHRTATDIFMATAWSHKARHIRHMVVTPPLNDGKSSTSSAAWRGRADRLSRAGMRVAGIMPSSAWASA